MQSYLYAPSNSHYFPLQWQSREIKLINLKPNKFSPKTLAFTNSLRTSIGSNPEEGLEQGPLPGEDAARLPVVIRRSGRVSRYVWNGSCLQLLGVDGGASSFSIDSNDGFRQLFRTASLGIRNFFIPKQVPDNYMGYVKWKLLHRVFSSASQVLATQAMFQAIGIGYSQSLPSAAALNWVLKDGLGRLCRCVYTASLASAFDTNLKTLTKDRLEIILNTWIDLRYVPSPAEVSKKDGINLLPKGMEFCPIRIGFLNTESQIPELSMMAMQSLTDEDYHFICMEKFCRGFSRTTNHGLLLCLREGAETADVIMGLLQACYIRNALLLNQNRWGINLEVSDYSDANLKEWIKLVDDSKRYSKDDMQLLTDEMEGTGWTIKNILLSMGEQARYSFVDN